MPLTIIRQDITTMHVDVIVNAANTQLRKGGGVCGEIFSAAGAENLQTACDAYAPIKVGGAVLTSGFKLPARYIIHAVGPVYKEGKSNEEELLSQQQDPQWYNDNVIWPDKVRINKEYIKQWSLLKDIKYILQTIIN